MTLADDVDLEVFIMAKDELSGADIKAICTEAGLLALRERRMKVPFRASSRGFRLEGRFKPETAAAEHAATLWWIHVHGLLVYPLEPWLFILKVTEIPMAIWVILSVSYFTPSFSNNTFQH